MRARRSIAARLILVVSVCTASILLTVLGFDYWRSLATLEREIERNAVNLTQSSARRIETWLMSVATATESLARALEIGHFDDAGLRTLLRRSLEPHEEIYGLSFEWDRTVREAQDIGSGIGGLYFCRKTGRVDFCPDTPDYDPSAQDWYRLPREHQTSLWTEPYFDSGSGDALMVTLSVPLFEGAGEGRRFRGVLATDLALDALTQAVSAIQVLETGYAILLSPKGTFITHPNAELAMRASLFSLPKVEGEPDPSLIGNRILSGTSGSIPRNTLFGIPARLYYTPIHPSGWTLLLVMPEDEIDDDARRLALTTTAIGLTGLLLMLVAIVLIARSITRPLRDLVAASGRIAAGRFADPLPDAGEDEVGELTRAFATMTQALAEHIRQLTLTTAAKERIESELKIAHDIQMSILPKIFPPLPKRDEIDLFALVEPAKEVGGDFYDFFQIDERRLCLVIADVSGKGVPASLFMAVTKTLIKATAKPDRSAAEILRRVNNELARDNDQSMFVTVFCALLDLPSGALSYANAGHNPPLRLAPDGTLSYLPCARQLALGVMEDIDYRLDSITLDRGDRLLLYTDGVTEAMNRDDQPYAEARLERELDRLRDQSLIDITQGLVASIRAYADGAPQSDDITLMLLDYRGVPGSD